MAVVLERQVSGWAQPKLRVTLFPVIALRGPMGVFLSTYQSQVDHHSSPPTVVDLPALASCQTCHQGRCFVDQEPPAQLTPATPPDRRNTAQRPDRKGWRRETKHPRSQLPEQSRYVLLSWQLVVQLTDEGQHSQPCGWLKSLAAHCIHAHPRLPMREWLRCEGPIQKQTEPCHVLYSSTIRSELRWKETCIVVRKNKYSLLPPR
jgi:hypothetical protein